MVSWGWLVFVFFGGATIGLIGMALFAAGDTDDYDLLVHKLWESRRENTRQRQLLLRWRDVCIACEGSDELITAINQELGLFAKSN